MKKNPLKIPLKNGHKCLKNSYSQCDRCVRELLTLCLQFIGTVK